MRYVLSEASTKFKKKIVTSWIEAITKMA